MDSRLSSLTARLQPPFHAISSRSFRVQTPWYSRNPSIITMSKVLKTELVHQVVKNGSNSVQLALATQTESYKRVYTSPETIKQFLADTQTAADKGLVAPEIKEIACVMPPHESQKDTRTHWTALFMVKVGDVSTGFMQHILHGRKD
ncbi:hypothetical protein GGTG_04768 [Gaeumannomyces tritici R3-111a-1]|uniref:Uncharacterized protein n=1 Tax=Gaeumannomyces tritici (strain R3-111a-1) TaxID=644352 RepID=J3NU17_GAET3|nr:hypothetical protein GGTG_04768 [Gaeumannomyces tritici R3-111a-1]EJT79684.1 hypothetical protein GGTG_04768 [Gaeumannomyces tritici R3-111a-1]